MSTPDPRRPTRRLTRLFTSALAVGGLCFLLSAIAIFAFLRQSPQLYDNDSYYHLAVARAYGTEGLVDDLRWARFSIMADGFGDKELLFHLLLVPFSTQEDFVLGGQLFLSLLLAGIFSLLCALAHPVLGRASLVLPFALVFASTELAWRLVRLRPELLSLLLLLAALWAVAVRRYRLLGSLALVYALSYTAFHAFLGLCFLQFLFRGLSRRSWEWPLLLYPTLGTGLGLLLHPHFPHNLAVWVLQSFDFFAIKGSLDVGTEIRPNYTDVILMVNLGWFLGLTMLWRSAEPDPSIPEERRLRLQALADTFGVAAAAFALLYLLMSRFSLYAIPFATLFVLFAVKARGRHIGRVTRLPLGGWLPLWLALTLCALVSLPEAIRQTRNYRERTSPGPDRVRLIDRLETARALPAGARVAAPWQQTPIYMLWAPHALYLNVLDPVFQARPFPVIYAAQSRLFSGQEPDVPLSAVTVLESDYLAFSLAADSGRLHARLDGDPRLDRRHLRINAVYRILPRRNGTFLLDWQLVPAALPVPPPAGADPASWTIYPRRSDPAGAAAEGFVDLRRLGAREGCVALSRMELGPRPRRFELAPWGPTSVWLDENLVVSTSSTMEAVLGQGIELEAQVPEGSHRLTVSTCTTAPGSPIGFYLRLLQ